MLHAVLRARPRRAIHSAVLHAVGAALLALNATASAQTPSIFALHRQESDVVTGTSAPYRFTKSTFDGTGFVQVYNRSAPSIQQGGVTKKAVEFAVEGRDIYFLVKFGATPSVPWKIVRARDYLTTYLQQGQPVDCPHLLRSNGQKQYCAKIALDGGFLYGLHQFPGATWKIVRWKWTGFWFTNYGSVNAPAQSTDTDWTFDVVDGELHYMAPPSSFSGQSMTLGRWAIGGGGNVAGIPVPLTLSPLPGWSIQKNGPVTASDYSVSYRAFAGVSLAMHHRDSDHGITTAGTVDAYASGGTLLASATSPRSSVVTVGSETYPRSYAFRIGIATGVVVDSKTPYGSGCPGTQGVPVIGSSDDAHVNTSFDVVLTSAPANAPAVLSIGASATSTALDPTGAPGCTLLNSAEILLPGTTDASGSATVSYQIPNDPSLLGVSEFYQFGVTDPGANALGWITTAGLEVSYGN